MAQDDYTWLFTKRIDEIKSNDCTYEYNKEKEILTITEDIPFQNFKYSLPDQKYELARNYYSSARIGSRVDELLGEKEEEEKEEKEENPSTAGSTNKYSPMGVLGPDWKGCSHKPEPIKLPSVLECLGPNWMEYFLKPETIKKIIRSVSYQNDLQDCYRKSFRRGMAGTVNDGMAYDFVEISSVNHLGADRQGIIASFRDIRSGLIEKWSLDITSTAPLLDQMLYALYNSNDDCAKKLIIYFEDFRFSNQPDIEVTIENDALKKVFSDISSFTDSVYPIRLETTDAYDEDSNVKIFFFCRQGLISDWQRKIPARQILESKIWNSYYGSFMNSSATKEKHQSNLVEDTSISYPKIPFLVWPEWTEKGLFMMLCADKDCPETNWLIKNKKDALARRYRGCEVKVDMRPGKHYCLLIHLHKAPVADFVESQTLAKFNYALEIREQQLAVIRNVEEIFRDYVPESK